jgi:hypothetical protein
LNEKGHNKIVFDRMIPATKGILFPMNFTWDAKNTNEATILKAGEGRENVGFESKEGANKSKRGTITESEMESEIESKIGIETVINQNNYDEIADKVDNVKYMMNQLNCKDKMTNKQQSKL